MIDFLARQAISCALKGDWEEAISLNQQILKDDATNVDALNRIAKAYFELAKIEMAKQISEEVLAIDPLNSIALRCLEKWSVIDPDNLLPYSKDSEDQNFVLELFIEEPGKTRIVKLLNLGDKKHIVTLDAGHRVSLSPGQHKVSVLTKNGNYIGCLPDDLSKRIIETMKNGNTYNALIKSTNTNEVTVFIREFKNGEQSSFRL